MSTHPIHPLSVASTSPAVLHPSSTIECTENKPHLRPALPSGSPFLHFTPIPSIPSISKQFIPPFPTHASVLQHPATTQPRNIPAFTATRSWSHSPTHGSRKRKLTRAARTTSNPQTTLGESSIAATQQLPRPHTLGLEGRMDLNISPSSRIANCLAVLVLW